MSAAGHVSPPIPLSRRVMDRPETRRLFSLINPFSTSFRDTHQVKERGTRTADTQKNGVRVSDRSILIVLSAQNEFWSADRKSNKDDGGGMQASQHGRQSSNGNWSMGAEAPHRPTSRKSQQSRQRTHAVINRAAEFMATEKERQQSDRNGAKEAETLARTHTHTATDRDHGTRK